MLLRDKCDDEHICRTTFHLPVFYSLMSYYTNGLNVVRELPLLNLKEMCKCDWLTYKSQIVKFLHDYWIIFLFIYYYYVDLTVFPDCFDRLPNVLNVFFIFEVIEKRTVYFKYCFKYKNIFGTILYKLKSWCKWCNVS